MGRVLEQKRSAHEDDRPLAKGRLIDASIYMRRPGHSGQDNASHAARSRLSSPHDALKPSADTLNSYRSLLGTLKTSAFESARPSKRRRLDGKGGRPQSPELKALDHDETSSGEGEEFWEVDVDIDANDSADPFAVHIADEGAELRDQLIKDIKGSNWATHRQHGTRTSMILKYPSSLVPKVALTPNQDEQIQIPHLKRRISEKARQQTSKLALHLRTLSCAIFEYKDVLYPQRTHGDAEKLRQLVCLHCLNHVLKTRDQVLRNNTRLNKNIDDDATLRDQGFTRPKVLILLPTSESCHRYVSSLLSLYEPDQVENKKRFDETFSSPSDQVSTDKPVDFQELFSGNDGDMFRLGLKFTRKSIKLFSKFYSSDIIIGSPLGLRLALEGNSKQAADKDFLSSIELLIVDQADALQMQNWEHVQIIVDSLNLQPKESHGCDFSRVRNWYLDGHARYLRQTIIFSSFNFSSLNQLYGSHMQNVAGKIKYCKEETGVLDSAGAVPRQTFSRFNFRSISTEPDDRFKCFTNILLPALVKSKAFAQQPLGALIWLPTYVDFVRVRNYLDKALIAQDISFGVISEYTPVRDVARARSHFLTGKHSLLLYTERAHHFRRYRIQGVNKVIMYGMPENPIFYREIVGGYLGASFSRAVLDEHEADVKILYSKLDALKLERIVGSDRYLTMLNENGGDTFDFSS